MTLNTHNDPVVPSFSLPLGQWVRLRFVHDGVSTAELSVDGQPVARINEPLWPVNGTNSITIGDATNPSGSHPENMLGRIDTVRIWRLNPYRPDQEFMQRPLDEEVKDCWAQWTREMGVALYSDPDCAEKIQVLLVRAVESVLRDGLNGSDDTRAKWLTAIAKYRELWRSGDLDNIVPVVADLISFLLLQGLDPRPGCHRIPQRRLCRPPSGAGAGSRMRPRIQTDHRRPRRDTGTSRPKSWDTVGRIAIARVAGRSGTSRQPRDWLHRDPRADSEPAPR